MVSRALCGSANAPYLTYCVRSQPPASTDVHQEDTPKASGSDWRHLTLSSKILGLEEAGSSYGCLYIKHLYNRILATDAETRQLIAALAPNQIDDAAASVVDFVTTAVSQFRDERLNPQLTTIEDVRHLVCQQLLKDDGRRQTSAAHSPEQLEAAHRLLLATVGWLSFIYEPASLAEPGVFAVKATAESSGETDDTTIQGSVSQCIRRPWSKVSYELGNFLPRLSVSQDGERNTSVHVSTVNWNILRVMGKVSITWTSSIGDHLQLDPRRRRLSLFRYPSYCAMCCVSDHQLSLFMR